LGIPLRQGRSFSDSDSDPFTIPVIVNDRLAQQHFNGTEVLGSTISQGRPASVVGVVGTVSRYEIGEAPKPTIYYHLPQYSWLTTMYVVARSTLTTESVTALVRQAIRELDPAVAVYDARSMEERVNGSVGGRRLAMQLLAGFAALAIVLAVLGIYGLLSYLVAQRHHEFGVRLALGATPREVSWLIVRGGATLAALGLIAGLLAFVAIAPVMSALLYQTGPRDPTAMLVAAGALALATTMACWLPARRAAHVTPLDAIRTE
jgi:predicted lysophospholipase L1 biosynthesis ABC-type transport system permease subunit